MDSCNRSQPHIILRSIIMKIFYVIATYTQYHKYLTEKVLIDRIIDYIMIIKKDVDVIEIICSYLLMLISSNTIEVV